MKDIFCYVSNDLRSFYSYWYTANVRSMLDSIFAALLSDNSISTQI